ncbi:MAG: repressor LexA [Clostridiales bacterium]|nr:repressor LexA [Clostridiales bacterium]
MRYKSEETMQSIIDFIDDYYFKNNYTPTLIEIAQKVGIDKSNVSRYLKEMSQKGLIDLSHGYRKIKTDKISKSDTSLVRVPVVGTVACGNPIFAEENVESYLTISASFLGSGEHFALKAKGDSMINAGIEDGDYVIARKQNTAQEGQIVVALVGDSATLKRYFIDKQKKMIRLHPENDSMQDLYFEKADIQGVVKKVIKDVR